MNPIFLNYRREESSAVAGRLHDRLEDRFGGQRVFMDIASIEPGEDWSTAIERAVAASQVMLVLIGRQWATVTDSGGNRRLDDPSDWIRVELEATFEHNVVVVPVLIDDARMPRMEHLPAPLRGLAMLQPTHLHRDRFQSDVEALLDSLEDIVESASARTPGVPGQHAPVAPFARTRLDINS